MTTEPITLKGVCAELKIDPRIAREKLYQRPSFLTDVRPAAVAD